MEENGRKTLVGLLFYVIATMVLSTGLFVAVMQMKSPPVIGFVMFLTVIVLFALIIIVCIDFITDNRTAVQGVLVERKDLFNGYRLQLRPDGTDLLRKFSMNIKFAQQVDGLQIDDLIEVQYYKLTRVVVSVRKLT